MRTRMSGGVGGAEPRSEPQLFYVRNEADVRRSVYRQGFDRHWRQPRAVRYALPSQYPRLLLRQTVSGDGTFRPAVAHRRHPELDRGSEAIKFRVITNKSR